MTIQTNDVLLEIGCEELPAKLLPSLANSLYTTILADLKAAQINFGVAQWFATPRRLAVLIRDVALQQSAQKIERRGPALTAAYADGKPRAALQGFLKTNGITLTQLIKEETPKGVWLVYRDTIAGQKTVDLLPTIFNSACKKLPIPKLMRWGGGHDQFIRPVRWLVALFGATIVPMTLFGNRAGRLTYGHRFMTTGPIILTAPADYEKILATQGKVVADFFKRKNSIARQIKKIARAKQASIVINEDLLTEVCGLVEWPVALLASFDPLFLSVPAEVLIACMQGHQKCFTLRDQKDNLLPYFITISNINRRGCQNVIHGNEKVIRARLADARFFYTTDLKFPLSHYLEKLKTIIFQQGLGSLFDKSQRIAHLAQFIFTDLVANNANLTNNKFTADAAYTSGLLCKADLATYMVGEFPELQGTMGYYYAKQSAAIKHRSIVCHAIVDHYKPRFSGDEVTMNPLSAAVALADKIDTLIGIFGINQKPNGEKDPFGLRRAALGIIRISLENNYHYDLKKLLIEAEKLFSTQLKNSQVVSDVLAFIVGRLRFYSVDANLFNAVIASQQCNLYDFNLRAMAVKKFLTLPVASGLIAANKRVSNILAKEINTDRLQVNAELLQVKAEQVLWRQILKLTPAIIDCCANKRYQAALKTLASLKLPIDNFFDQVMVMTEEIPLRKNRLALLRTLQDLFLKIADISALS